MKKTHLILFSHREEDPAFFESLAKASGLVFLRVLDRHGLQTALIHSPQALLAWAIDAPDANLSMIREQLSPLIPPGRVIAISDEPLSRYPALFAQEQLPFQHHFFRRNPESSAPLYGKILETIALLAEAPFPLGLEHYFPRGTSGQRLRVEQSRQRSQVIDAVQAGLVTHGAKNRIASRVAQATDELLLNALFNAPRDAFGHSHRKLLPRNHEFALADREQIEVELMSCETYAAVRVTDFFGSLQRGPLLKCLAKNYTESKITVRDERGGTTSGSALGLAGIIEIGLSLLYVTQPGARTDAMIFLPHRASPKELRDRFQFFSFFGGTAENAAPGLGGSGLEWFKAMV